MASSAAKLIVTTTEPKASVKPVPTSPNRKKPSTAKSHLQLVQSTQDDASYQAELKNIVDRLEFLRANCSTDLANAMNALANGDLTVELAPKTPLLEVPKHPDLAIIAEVFNGLRNQTVAGVEAYNKAKDALSRTAAEKVQADLDFRAEVKVIADRMEMLRGLCITGLMDGIAALAKGDLTVEVVAKTPKLDIPEQPELATVAKIFNQVHSQVVQTIEGYNQARGAQATAAAEKATTEAEYRENVRLIADRMEFLRANCSTDLAVAMESLAHGDLTITLVPKTPLLEIPPQADLALMAETFNNLRNQTVQSVNAYNSAQQALGSLLAQTQVAVTSITDASTEVMTGNDDLAQRTEEQAASLEETASSMEEMTATVKQNADNAKQANQLAMSARESAEKGGKVVSSAVSTMDEINAASKRIADIISVIDEIAFQTNLLALNAAVEAARVGEQGRGFAVVAAEVRNLAGRSATAAKEIKGLVQDSVQKVQEGSSLVNQSGTQLEEIVNSVKKVADIIAEISAAAQEQSAGIEQVNKAITQMDQITQQNAALVEEASAASQGMNQQAAGLQSVVEKFKIDSALTSQLQAKLQTEQLAAAAAAKKAHRDRSSRNQRPETSSRRPGSASAVAKRRPAASDLDDFEEF